MKKLDLKLKKALFIFRRDLRLQDNTGLSFALKQSQKVTPCFIFTPEQIEKNPYRGDRCLQFMIESLEDLMEAIEEKGGRLFFFYGKPEEIVFRCIRELGVGGIIVNRDYTPYSTQRDKKIETVCKREKALFHSFDDALLHPPEETLKGNGKPYTIFTPFYNNASRIKVPKEAPFAQGAFEKGAIPFAKGRGLLKEILPKRFDQAPGGRAAALAIIKSLEKFSRYDSERDILALNKTSHLSPHLKFTTVSAREVYSAVAKAHGKSSPLIRSLYWRDFYSCIALHFPHVFGRPFDLRFEDLAWICSKKNFALWREGKTGFPIVDAGMREMNETGFMHNRARMIVASFLVKDLHIDWRWGEKVFAQKLIDYDPAVNNGNWQWSASTGCDAQPYFRILNPWRQQERFDPDCAYIKRWVPELKEADAKIIHKWYDEKLGSDLEYPRPMLDHSKESKKALELYREAAGK